MSLIGTLTKDQIIERLQSATTLLIRAQRAVEGSVTTEPVGDILDDAEEDIRIARAALAMNASRDEAAIRYAGGKCALCGGSAGPCRERHLAGKSCP